MTTRTRRLAHRRLRLDRESTRTKRLAACKKYLRMETETITTRIKAGEPGIKVARSRSKVIDSILTELFAHGVKVYRESHSDAEVTATLIALGGYGRAEQAPLSDIDIMFLYTSGIKANKIRDLQQVMTDEILFVLWDLGLMIGHSSRSVDEAFGEAKSDMQTMTSMLESRIITGDEQLFASFSKAYRNFYL